MDLKFAEPIKPQQEMKLQIVEDPEIAQGRYAHVFLNSYDPVSEHYRLDFYQDSIPYLESTQVNRRLVARIFLTKAGLTQMGKYLTDLNNQMNQPRLPEPETKKNQKQ